MQKSVSDLLDLCFELEGLLLLAERRDSSTPARVVELINQRINQLSEMSGEVFFAASVTESQQTADDKEIAASMEFEEEGDSDEAPAIQPAVDPQPAPKPQPEAEPQPVVAPQPVVEAPAPVSEPEPVVIPEPEPEPIVVSEPVAVSSTSEIPKHPVLKLTLNDKFRLKSAVFGGSESDMNEALQQIASLSDLEEINEYIVNDLCLDPDDPEVAYFIELVENSRK